MGAGLLVARALWLSAPVVVTGILHMVVVKLDLWPALRRPIDGGRTWRGKPLFGPNKTWRGVVVMTAGAALLGAAQGAASGAWAQRRGAAVPALRGVPMYALVNAVLGLGYALGELPNSFLKRRLRVAPGKTGAGGAGLAMFVLDQADSVIVPLVLGALLFPIGWDVVAVGIACLTALHLFLNWALHVAGVRRNL